MLMQSPEPGNDRILGNLPAGPVRREDSEKAEEEHLSVSSRATEFRKGEDGCSPPPPPRSVGQKISPVAARGRGSQEPQESTCRQGNPAPQPHPGALRWAVHRILGLPSLGWDSEILTVVRILQATEGKGFWKTLYLKATLRHRNVPGYPAFGGCGCREWGADKSRN